VRWGADQRQQLEHLCRYITRPAIANERLKRNGAGQVVLQLKSSYKDGTTHIVMSPQWSMSMSKTRLSSLTQLMRAELRRRLEDHRRHRRSAGDCQNPRPSEPAYPRPTSLPRTAIRSIPNGLRAETGCQRKPTMPLGLSLSERSNGEQWRGSVRCKLCLSRSRSQLLWRVSHSNGPACPPQRLPIGWGANRFGLNLIFAEKGLYENRVPEVSLAQILRHPQILRAACVI
jgi:Putative transposase